MKVHEPTLTYKDRNVDIESVCLQFGGVGMNLDKALPLILRECVSADGHLVNYGKLQKLAPWKDHIDGKKLVIADNDILKKTEVEKKCFFINLYNLLCMYAVSSKQTLPPEVMKVQRFFDLELCVLAGQSFSLNEILHGILRANKPHPSSNTPFFGSNSSKRTFCMKTLDPRILFAVNSADITSPALRYFSPGTLEADLNAAVISFLATAVTCNAAGRSVVIPRLFLWYRKDFPGGHDVGTVRWIAQYMNPADSKELTNLMDDLETFGGVRIIHDNCDWRLNNFTS